MDLIKESWEDGPSPVKNEAQYILNLQAELYALGVLSRKNLLQVQAVPQGDLAETIFTRR